jgi:FkbM family methyltransferase
MSRLRNILRATKRELLGPGEISILGRPYRVAYEAREAWDEPDFAVMAQLARGRDCVFDVGANKGITTLLMAAAAADSGVVYAFEPSEEGCRIVGANAALNGLDRRIRIVNALVAAHGGQCLDFSWDGSSVFAGILSDQQAGAFTLRESFVLQKATISLDDFSRQHGLTPDFIKIDVEGAEILVLRGMSELLRTARPAVFVECHVLSDRSAGANAMDLLACVQPFEYRMIRLKTGAEVRDIHAFDGLTTRTYLLLLPLERDPAPWLADLDTTTLT